jgi:site-specific DNA recombinase
MKAAGYIRVSTEGQATEGVSLQAQADAIRQYAEYKGFELVHEIEDAGISGGINKAREGFIRLLDLIQSGEVQIVILFSLERLSRDMLTLLCLEKLLDEYDVQLHSVEGEFNTSTPDGFMSFAMKAFLGEMERRQVKYRTRKALEFKRRNGQVFNHAPYGYRREGESLIPVATEQAIILEGNRMYNAGARLVDIVHELNRAGRTTRNGKEWSPQQVKRLLHGYENTFKKTTTRIGSAARAFIECVA